jgi:lysophospholipase L1-like esterase
MKQIFLFGASTIYGVGGASGGIGDILKSQLHRIMYGPDPKGEVYEVYNFAKSGNTAQDVFASFPQQLNDYRRDCESIAILSVGINDTKAIDTPDNFACSPDDYKAEMSKLLKALIKKVDHVICIGFGVVDENKTNPKLNPLTGRKSYYTNARIGEFNAVFEQLCHSLSISFVRIDENPTQWSGGLRYQDGLHPNESGHQFIFDRVWLELKKSL